MKFGSGLSNADDYRSAIGAACDQALAGLGGEAPDLAIFFTTPHHAQSEEALGQIVRGRTKAAALVGTTAQAVIGGGRESEDGPGLAVFLARLPGVEVRPFILPPQEVPEAPLDVWREAIPARPGEKQTILLLADPFSIHIVGLLEAVNEGWPGTPIVGGVASGGFRPGMNRLYAQDVVATGGAVGIVLAGAVEARTIVSQGCRPIGRHLVITKAKGNVIREIGGKTALAALRDVIGSLDERDQTLAARALHVGRAIDERRDSFGRGDFLIRNPVGIDPESGALAVGDYFRAGQTIQLHVRDAASADEDLRHLLEAERDAAGRGGDAGGRMPPRERELGDAGGRMPPREREPGDAGGRMPPREREPGDAGGRMPLHARGALLFSCNGRGKRFFGIENHDTAVMMEVLGDLPIAGFFCGGEFGPVGGKNFIHGYTSSIIVFGEEKSQGSQG